MIYNNYTTEEVDLFLSNNKDNILSKYQKVNPIIIGDITVKELTTLYDKIIDDKIPILYIIKGFRMTDNVNVNGICQNIKMNIEDQQYKVTIDSFMG